MCLLFIVLHLTKVLVLSFDKISDVVEFSLADLEDL